jgi:hypothetical protein
MGRINFFSLFEETVEKLRGGRWQYEPPETPHEKFYSMVEKNPELLKLKEKFDLEVDL